MDFELNQEIEIKEGKFIIKKIDPTPQGFYNIRFNNLKDDTPWIRGKSILEMMIKSFEKEKLTKKTEKEEKRKVRRKEEFLKTLEKAEVVDPYIGEGAGIEQKIKFYRSLGHISRHSEISADVSIKVKEWFEERYNITKGKYPNNKCCYLEKKWASELRIRFDLPDNITSQDIVFGPEVNLVLSNTNYDWEINNNDLGWYLLSLGLDFGKDHDINKIESHIPNEFIKYFKEGL